MFLLIFGYFLLVWILFFHNDAISTKLKFFNELEFLWRFLFDIKRFFRLSLNVKELQFPTFVGLNLAIN